MKDVVDYESELKISPPACVIWNLKFYIFKF